MNRPSLRSFVWVCLLTTTLLVPTGHDAVAASSNKSAPRPPSRSAILKELQDFSSAGLDRRLGPEGTDEFECGGIMEFPGQPFCISATNAN